MDPRIQRTKKNIKNAFGELMEGSDFDSLSISDIVKKAGINRSTFYDHYQDKYHLLVEFYFDKIVMLEDDENLEKDRPLGYNQIIDLLEKSLIYSKEHKEIAELVFSQSLQIPYLKDVKEHLKEFYMGVSDTFGEAESTSVVPKEILAYFCAAGFNYIYLLWTTGELNWTAREMAGYTMKLNLILASSMKGIDPKTLPFFDFNV